MDLDRKIDLKELALWVVMPVVALYRRLRSVKRTIRASTVPPSATRQAQYFREHLESIDPRLQPISTISGHLVQPTNPSDVRPIAVSGAARWCAATGQWVPVSGVLPSHIAVTGSCSVSQSNSTPQ